MRPTVRPTARRLSSRRRELLNKRVEDSRTGDVEDQDHLYVTTFYYMTTDAQWFRFLG